MPHFLYLLNARQSAREARQQTTPTSGGTMYTMSRYCWGIPPDEVGVGGVTTAELDTGSVVFGRVALALTWEWDTVFVSEWDTVVVWATMFVWEWDTVVVLESKLVLAWKRDAAFVVRKSEKVIVGV